MLVNDVDNFAVWAVEASRVCLGFGARWRGLRAVELLDYRRDCIVVVARLTGHAGNNIAQVFSVVLRF